MQRINLLTQDTANKIAAGEVVERASSVVKELVENSIDAGSKNITIEIEESGSSIIRISDDGQGIHPDDIEKAFMPHGTSKIANINDIFAISTFGFRGEALPSIAAISKVKIISRIAEFDFGKEMYIEGGKIQYIKDVGCNVGTIIEVRDLFYNVPARQKFLKSPQRENSLINDLMLRLALGNYGVTFKFFSNGKEVFKSLSTCDLIDTVRTLYGKQVYDNVIPFENHSDIISIHGFIGNSEISRGSRNRQSIFVNKRLIKSSLITAAVENAFKSFITVNKFPFFVAYIDIFPDYIDPNVHPTKAEIKFFDEKTLFKLVFDGVHSALKESLRSTFNIEADDDKYQYKNENMQYKENTTVQLPIDFNSIKYERPEEIQHSYFKENNGNKEVAEEKFQKLDYKESFQNPNELKVYEDFAHKGIYNNKPEEEIIRDNEKVEPKFPQVKVIGQFNNSYIIAEYNRELYLIDQHAAHEKMLFEKYKKSIAKAQVISQILITPLVIELTYDDYSYYIDNEDIFKNCGFDIEVFGENSIAIREVPMFLGKPDLKNLFYEIIENIKSLGSGKTTEVKYNKIASLACKAAVKANDKLSQQEMEALTQEMRYLEEPFTCPHGRPTIIKFTLHELEKRFKRIQ
ncbi:DNA mismatch repair endonuclease MutL [Clostridium sp.]|uniref:DNA mismatch repair endonuclease MutL n=1 Tax=Clostridium sp. TaxID=1506 RepID=UPI002FC8FB5E